MPDLLRTLRESRPATGPGRPAGVTQSSERDGPAARDTGASVAAMTTPGIPGIDAGSVTPVLIDGEPVTGSASTEVRAPYDGTLLGSIPALGAAEVDRAVAAAKKALHETPLPQWKRAEILDKAALLLAEREEDFARCIAQEAAKPIRTARAEAQRAVSHPAVLRGRGPLARGRGRAARGVGRRRGQARVHPARAGRRGRRDRAVQLPAQPRRAQARPGDRGRLPGGAQAGVADAVLLDPARARAVRGGAAAGLPARRHRRRVHGRQRARRPRRRRAHHLHRLARGRLGHPRPRAAQAGRARARQQRAAHHRGRRRLAERRRQGQGRGLLPRRPVLHLDAADVRAPLDRRRRRRAS